MIAFNMQRVAKSALAPKGQLSVVLQRRLLSKTSKTAVANSLTSPSLEHTVFSHKINNSLGAPTSTLMPIQPWQAPHRNFSTITPEKKANLEQELNALDMSIVPQIKAELMEVDANFDGRIQPEELKELLKKHNASFTDEEVLEITDLYYAAKAGGSVSFENFISAIDHVVANEKKDEDAKLEAEHFKESKRHPLGAGKCAVEYMYAGKSHGHYTEEELDVKLTHVEPKGIRDKLAYNAVKGVRFVFDTATGWNNNEITQKQILFRTIYLETIAAVPGMVAAIVRHFKSLRSMERDGGMLQMFLEEANNERMHLLTFVGMKDPGPLFRLAVLGGQIGFGSLFLLAYMVSPNFCHRFVGYVEEEACSTYTKIIDAIEAAPEGSELAEWRTQRAPKIAIAYWKLGENGTVLDLMRAVRSDEAEHRDVNHLVCGMKPGQVNPLYDPQAKLDMMLLKYAKDMMKASPAS